MNLASREDYIKDFLGVLEKRLRKDLPETDTYYSMIEKSFYITKNFMLHAEDAVKRGEWGNSI